MQQSFLENQSFILICMCMAVLRIYLEVINFKFSALPLTKAMGQSGAKFHKMGLYISVGYVVLFAPQVLLS